jgi:hypothetical protein
MQTDIIILSLLFNERANYSNTIKIPFAGALIFIGMAKVPGCMMPMAE